jgi:hypothetical protein
MGQELFNQHYELELSDEYKLMIDEMLEKENNGETEYVSLETIKKSFAFS